MSAHLKPDGAHRGTSPCVRAGPPIALMASTSRDNLGVGHKVNAVPSIVWSPSLMRMWIRRVPPIRVLEGVDLRPYAFTEGQVYDLEPRVAHVLILRDCAVLESRPARRPQRKGSKSVRRRGVPPVPSHRVDDPRDTPSRQMPRMPRDERTANDRAGQRRDSDVPTVRSHLVEEPTMTTLTTRGVRGKHRLGCMCWKCTNTTKASPEKLPKPQPTPTPAASTIRPPK
jgi:hypothetical protein